MTSLPMQADIERGADKSHNSALAGVYKRAPMHFVRGEGVELIDEEGKRYLDFVSGIGVNALGYGDAGIAATIADTLRTGLIHVSNLFQTDAGEKLASELARLSFAAKVFLCNSGAEANEGAFKFARRWARARGNAAKNEIIALRGGFHGRLFASLAATDRPSYRAPFRPLAGAISICERDIEDLEVVLDPETVAAVIVEPIQGEGGVRVLDASFLSALRDLTREREIALIFDEIQCGLGRTGHLFAYQRVSVIPDIVTLAKPLAGGMPMGAVLMTEEIASAMNPGEHGTTFGGGPLVSSVACHVLERLSDESLLGQVRANGEIVRSELAAMSESTEKIRAFRGAGLMWGVDVVEPAAEIVRRAWDRGLLMLTAGDHTLRLLPPLVIEASDLERGLRIIKTCIQD